MDNFTFDWFRHDKDLRNDPKIKILRKKYPGWGYSVWLMLLEILCDSKESRYKWDDLSVYLLAADCDIDEQLLQQILDTMLQLNLIQMEEEEGCRYLACQKFRERTDDMLRKKEQTRAAGIASGAARRAKSNGRSTDVQRESTNDEQTLNGVEQMLNAAEREKEKRTKKEIEKDRIEENFYYSSFEKEKEKDFFIYYFFFDRRFKSPAAEYEAMVQWNNAPGRIPWKELTEDQMKSCAAQWRSKEQREAEKTHVPMLPHLPDYFYGVWEKMFEKCASLGADDTVLLGLLSNKVSFTVDTLKQKLIFTVPTASGNFIKENWETLRTGLSPVLQPLLDAFQATSIGFKTTK